jgi:hypothetical protein
LANAKKDNGSRKDAKRKYFKNQGTLLKHFASWRKWMFSINDYVEKYYSEGCQKIT